MNLQEELKALKERIAELEEKVKEEDEFPRNGDEYWYVDADADVMDIEWDGSDCDQDRLSIDNVFKTKEQAEFVVEKLKVEAELRKFSKTFEYGKINYFLYLNIDGDNFKFNFTNCCPPQGAIYFESKEKAEEAVKSVGEERIKKYIFGAEDYL